METISRSGRAVRGFALGDVSADPSAGSGTTTHPGDVSCSPPFFATVMTGTAVGLFTSYALNAPRWASITAGIAAALFVPVRTVHTTPTQ
jgi:hypothetical protein